MDHFVRPPPPLAKLLTHVSYGAEFSNSLRRLHCKLPGAMADLGTFDDAVATQVIAACLSYACECQANANIELGRAALMAAPRRLVLATLNSVAGKTIDLRDEWEFRRYVELLSLLDPEAARVVGDSNATSSQPELREAAQDYLDFVRPDMLA